MMTFVDGEQRRIAPVCTGAAQTAARAGSGAAQTGWAAAAAQRVAPRPDGGLLAPNPWPHSVLSRAGTRGTGARGGAGKLFSPARVNASAASRHAFGTYHRGDDAALQIGSAMKRPHEALDELPSPQLRSMALLTPPPDREPLKRPALARPAALPSFQRTLDAFLGVPSRPVWPGASAHAAAAGSSAAEPAEPAEPAKCAACGCVSADAHEVLPCENCAASSCRACSVRRDAVRCLDCC